LWEGGPPCCFLTTDSRTEIRDQRTENREQATEIREQRNREQRSERSKLMEIQS
jgi:hypothetical protein